MLDFQPVTIHLAEVCERLAVQENREVTDIEASHWLRAHGFVPANDPLGFSWLGDEPSLHSLEELFSHRSDELPLPPHALNQSN